MKTALVTGASGFIGRKLCERLRSDGVRVIALVGRSVGDGPWDKCQAVDIADAPSVAALASVIEPVDAVFHLAGKAHALAEIGASPDDYRRINADGTRNIAQLAAALGAKRFVLAGTVKAMGEGDFEPADGTASCAPKTPYGISKYEAERILFEEGPVSEPVVIRLSMVYGGKERGNMTRMVEAVKRRRFPPFPETGNRRSMVHVDDAVSAFLLAATHPDAPGGAFVVTDGRFYSTRDIYLTIRHALGLGAPVFTPPLWFFRCTAKAGDLLGKLAGRRMPLDSDSLAKLTDSAAYDDRLIREKLGFVSRKTLEDGVRDTLAALKG